MHHINKLQSGMNHIQVGHYSDEDDLPPAKRPRDSTIISDYEDMWNNPVMRDDRPTILTPPSLVSS